MARIISGVPQAPTWDGGAVLRGYQDASRLRMAEEANRLSQAQMLFRVQQALEEQQNEERANAEMAQVGKIGQYAQQSQVQGRAPGQKVIERVIGARSKLKDPKAIAFFDETVTSLLKQQESAKQRKLFNEHLSMAEKDSKVFAPEMVQDWRRRYEAGEDPQKIQAEMSKHRQATVQASVAAKENAAVLEKLQAQVDSMDEGPEKDFARAELETAMLSDSFMQTKGAGAELSTRIREANLKSLQKQGKSLGYENPALRSKVVSDLLRETGGAKEPTEEEIRARMRMIDPSLPEPQPPSVTRPPFLKIDYIVNTSLQGGADQSGIRQALQDAGIDLTEDVAKMVKMSIDRWNAGLNSGRP